MDRPENVTWCPSSEPSRPEALILGIHAGQDRPLVYLGFPVPAAEIADLVPPAEDLRQVARFAGHCDRNCKHRNGNDCGLAAKIVKAAPAAPDGKLPLCILRPRCQWWIQTGPDACRRCPLIATLTPGEDAGMKRVADPSVGADDI